MTEQKKIQMLRAMASSEEDGEILSVYLELAAAKILTRMYPFTEDVAGMDVPDRYVPMQLNVACYLMNKRGAEGEVLHIENGVHRSYGDADVPDSMLKEVVPFCQAVR